MKSLFAATVSLVLGIAVLPVWGQQGAQGDSGRMYFPATAWALVVELPGFKLGTNETKPDGRRYMLATNETTGVVISITLEQVEGAATARECRDARDRRVKGRANTLQDIRTSEKGEMALLEYTLVLGEGYNVQQKHLFACLPKEDVYVDIHFSKVRFQWGEEKLFTSILDTLRFEEKDSLDLLGSGSFFYLKKDYSRAIEPYARALELEKGERTLEENYWRVLVDNLGMAYGVTGDLQRAKETFEYGLSQDPTFPSFHYNLACAYAEMGDAENAMKYLKNAFDYKENRIPGEQMPDPRKDSSFQQLLKNEEFRRFVESLVSVPD